MTSIASKSFICIKYKAQYKSVLERERGMFMDVYTF